MESLSLSTATTEDTNSLQIIRANDLFIAESTEPRSFYVEVSVDDFHVCTRVAETCANPSWNETIQLPRVQPTAILTLKVMQSISTLPHEFLGGIGFPLQTLLGMQNEDVTLRLRAQPLESEPTLLQLGSITIHAVMQNIQPVSRPQILDTVDEVMEELIQWVSDEQISEGHSYRLQMLLSNIPFSSALGHMCLEQGDAKHISSSIMLFKAVVKLMPAGHPDKPKHLNILSAALYKQFCLLSNIADIKEAILHQKEVIHITHETDSNLPGYLHDLAVYHGECFQHLGDITDLHMAIQQQEKTVQMTPDGHPGLPLYLSSHGSSFETRFKHQGNIADLHEAILQKKRAVKMTPDGHPDLPMYLNNLGNAFHLFFKHLGNIEDLNMAISWHEEAVHATPDGDPHLPARLNNLGNALNSSFEYLQDIENLDRAILQQGKAVHMAPEGSPDMSMFLTNLGNSFAARFKHLGEITDLDMAIQHKTRAVFITPESHSDLPMYLSNLANSVQNHFHHSGEIEYLNVAILLHEKAVHITPEGHSSLPIYLNNLSYTLQERFEKLGDIADLNMAFLHQENAVHTTPKGHPNLPKYLTILGQIFITRFHHLGNIEDLNMAILHQEKAVHIAVKDAPDLPGHLSNLGDSLRIRFQKLGNFVDLESAISKFSRATKSFGSPSWRFRAASYWIKGVHTAFEDKIPDLLEAYTAALQLLPQVAWLGRNVDSRYHELLLTRCLACNAAAITLRANNIQQAVEWLEQGRSIVWGQTLQLRTPLDSLKEAYSELAAKLSQLSAKLEHGASATVAEHHTNAKQWESVVEEVRSKPNFSRFLLPKEYSELCQVSQNGIVIVVNVSTVRCDALIIKSPIDSPCCVHLSAFSHDQAQNLHSRLYKILTKRNLHSQGNEEVFRAGRQVVIEDEEESFRSILADLWLKVVKPVLNELSLQSLPKHLPRLWWCPTGPLAFLPLHAAGIYPASDKDKVDCLADYAISSYTPTLAALTASQRPLQDANKPVKLLAVIQPDIPNENSLVGTIKELEIIQKYATQPQMLTALTRTEATVDKVVSEMSEYSWIHLACHGKQDLMAPMKSGFLLQGGCLELSKIIPKAFPHAEFAFLSACETAVGDLDHPDEAIHLAAGMLSAGYRSVIATMWAISDNDAPFIADAVYSHLFKDEGQPSCQNAAEALHHAVQTLCNRLQYRSFASWVPFIHMGA